MCLFPADDDDDDDIIVKDSVSNTESSFKVKDLLHSDYEYADYRERSRRNASEEEERDGVFDEHTPASPFIDHEGIAN